MERDERCINCYQQFHTGDHDDRIFTIDLTLDTSSAFHDVVTVETVLSSIFSFNRINQLKPFIPVNQTNFGIDDADNDENINPAFCKRCAFVVGKLYNFYLELQQYAHPDSYMVRRTKELDSMMEKLEEMIGSNQSQGDDVLTTTTIFDETRQTSSSLSSTFGTGPWVQLSRITEEEIRAARVKNVHKVHKNNHRRRNAANNFQEEESGDQMDIVLGSVEVLYDDGGGGGTDYDPQTSPAYYNDLNEHVITPTAYTATTSDEDTKISENFKTRRDRIVQLKKKMKKKDTTSREKVKSNKTKKSPSSQQKIKRIRNIKKKNVQKVKKSSPPQAAAASAENDAVIIVDSQGQSEGGVVKKCLVCPICKKVYKKKYLRIHLKTHEPSGSRPQFQCTICSKFLFSAASLSTHIKAHDSGRNYSCNLCTMTFTQAGNLKGHIKSVHLQDRPFLCPLCGKSFAKSYGLKRHMNSHSEEKNLKCGIGDCEKYFNDIERLKKHQQIHMGELNQSLCSFCGKSYSNSAIKKHIRTHTGERPKKCPHLDCGLSFIDSRSLKRHIRRRHNNNIINNSILINDINNEHHIVFKDSDGNDCVQIEVSTVF